MLLFSKQLFYRAPVDRRNVLEKLVDLFGMEYVYATLGIITTSSLILLLRSLSLNSIINLGVGRVIQFVAVIAYLGNGGF